MRSFHKLVICLLAFVFTPCVASHSFAVYPAAPSPADPLTATIHTLDAERFARLFTATSGRPSEQQIQMNYLDNSSLGVSVFTPGRIQNAAHLAKAVAKDKLLYKRAIQDCLPQLKQYNADLRSIYLAMHGLYPDKSLPQIYVVFGAGNSGGTAAANAQVLGLEVICKTSAGRPDDLRTTLRRFFAHETVHTFQNEPSGSQASPLLAGVLTEGGADFIASIVTGETPEPERAKWAAPREAKLWILFQKDMLANQPQASSDLPKEAIKARHRWLENYKSAPPGWPFELGYWEGMRIWECYYEASADKHQAIRDVINWDNPEEILRKSGYRGQACSKPLTFALRDPTIPSVSLRPHTIGDPAESAAPEKRIPERETNCSTRRKRKGYSTSC